MSLFHHHRRSEVPLPVAQPPLVQEDQAGPPPCPPVPEPMPAVSEGAVLAYLERCLDGTEHRTARPERLNLMERVLELTSRDWPEDEAGAELAWLVGYDTRVLEALRHRLVVGLVRNPYLDVVGVRASRVTLQALEHCGPVTQPGLPWHDA